MADLDSFFAKKDKKKKTKKGFSKANTDVLARNLEENDIREKSDQVKTTLATSEATKLAFEDNPVIGVNGEGGGQGPAKGHPAARNDDEWLDYEHEKKDYSGLKIESLKIDDKVEENEDDHEINEDGEKIKIRKHEGGPWSKRAAQADEDNKDKSDSDDADDRSTPEPVSKPASSAAPSSYVPPHMRGGGPASNTAASGGSGLAPMRLGGGRVRNRQAPDISSEVYFPSLGSAGPGDDRSRGGEFEEVKSGGNSQQHSSRSSEAPRLALGNKFDALRD